MEFMENSSQLTNIDLYIFVSFNSNYTQLDHTDVTDNNILYNIYK